jgi:uncharacterized protein
MNRNPYDLMADKITLVIGASPKPERFSNKAVKRLVEKGFPLVAVGLREGEIEGVKIHKLFPVVSEIHTVSLYVGPRNQAVYYDFILNVNPQRVIFNPGTENPEFENTLKSRGIEVIRGCTLIMLGNGSY